MSLDMFAWDAAGVPAALTGSWSPSHVFPTPLALRVSFFEISSQFAIDN